MDIVAAVDQPTTFLGMLFGWHKCSSPLVKLQAKNRVVVAASKFLRAPHL